MICKNESNERHVRMSRARCVHVFPTVIKTTICYLKGQSHENVYEVMTMDGSFGLRFAYCFYNFQIVRLKAMIFQPVKLISLDLQNIATNYYNVQR
jgi:hypothetical protein